MEFVNNTLFKQKILSYTLAQVALLSFLLVTSVVLRIVLFPHNYLETMPLYVIVGYFFLGELFLLLYMTGCLKRRRRGIGKHFRNILGVAVVVSALVCMLLCIFLTGQSLFFSAIFLFFLVMEQLFNVLYYRRFFRTCVKF